MPPFFYFFQLHPTYLPMIDKLVRERHRLRRFFLEQRDQLSLVERDTGSEQILNTFVSLPIFQEKLTFFIYCHYRSEVRTIPLLDRCLNMGKTVSVPLSQPQQAQMEAVVITDQVHDLSPGYLGIPEPLARDRILLPASIEVAIIPGVVFDRCGHRLGYGMGFYDRFLALAAPQAIRIGLAFTCQLVDRIPALPHDVPMDMVLTEQEMLSWSRSSRAKNSRL